MHLTLEVISSQASSLGAASRRMVGPEGLTIGRAADNGWVLPDPYISKQQARISYMEGQFWVEGLGKNPIALGRAEGAIPNNEPRPLREGDRIFLDEYEVLVTLIQDEADKVTTPNVSPGVAPSAFMTERLALADEPFSSTGAHTGDSGMLAGGWRGSPSSARLNGLPGHAAQASPQRFSLDEHVDDHVDDRADDDEHEPVAAGHAAVMGRSPVAAAGTERTTVQVYDEGGYGDLLGLLDAAGVPEHDRTPELAQELGEVLRLSVQGVLETMRARAEIKAQFMLPVTRVQARENNPLKLMPNVESVLNTLLVHRNPAYMSTTEAFQDALADIRHHQAALLAALRATFEALLSTFDPRQLQQEFDAAGRRRFLGVVRAPRYWEQYTEHFQQLGNDPDETFRRLCGEVFADAYEQELMRLRRGPSRPRPQNM